MFNDVSELFKSELSDKIYNEAKDLNFIMLLSFLLLDLFAIYLTCCGCHGSFSINKSTTLVCVNGWFVFLYIILFFLIFFIGCEISKIMSTKELFKRASETYEALPDREKELFKRACETTTFEVNDEDLFTIKCLENKGFMHFKVLDNKGVKYCCISGKGLRSIKKFVN